MSYDNYTNCLECGCEVNSANFGYEHQEGDMCKACTAEWEAEVLEESNEKMDK